MMELSLRVQPRSGLSPRAVSPVHLGCWRGGTPEMSMHFLSKEHVRVEL